MEAIGIRLSGIQNKRSPLVSKQQSVDNRKILPDLMCGIRDCLRSNNVTCLELSGILLSPTNLSILTPVTVPFGVKVDNRL